MTHHNEPSLKGCRVLIVEDEYFLGDDLASAIRSLGAHVIGPVPELDEAMSVEHDGFDIALIDINLRGRSAYPIADELARLGKPFIFTTGYSADTIPPRFWHVRRCEKPYEPDQLKAVVAELCCQRLLLAV
ncbi:response regulator [Bradyrhizobium sp. ORS 86]|uniref:response regulator n=1 Tax=unclassified Bradyrhizobium TaxID=2631580 RepID=UPI00388E653F